MQTKGLFFRSYFRHQGTFFFRQLSATIPLDLPVARFISLIDNHGYLRDGQLIKKNYLFNKRFAHLSSKGFVCLRSKANISALSHPVSTKFL